MKEWDVVLVIVVLINMGLSIYNPLSKAQKDNTKAMTELTVTMKNVTERLLGFEKDMEHFETKNNESHRRIWTHNADQDKKIEDHETRLQIIEKEK